jgi:hypothetical protein
MAVLQWGLILFLAGFLIHLLVWRVHKPESPMRVLLALFLAVIVLGLVAVYCAGGLLRSVGLAGLTTPAAYLHVLVFSVSMALFYIAGYIVLEWGSPSLTIVGTVARAGAKGVDAAGLVDAVANLPFIESRILSLIRDHTIVEKGGRYAVAPGRHLYYRALLFYSRLVRREETQTG